MTRFSMIDSGNKPYKFHPSRKHMGDAGIDLYNNGEHVEIKPGEVKLIHTYTRVDIPENCVGWITNKGGPNYLVGAGIVDHDYQGELIVKVFNPTYDIVHINLHQAVAQLLIIPCIIDDIEYVEDNELFTEESERGVSGGIHG